MLCAHIAMVVWVAARGARKQGHIGRKEPSTPALFLRAVQASFLLIHGRGEVQKARRAGPAWEGSIPPSWGAEVGHAAEMPGGSAHRSSSVAAITLAKPKS